MNMLRDHVPLGFSLLVLSLLLIFSHWLFEYAEEEVALASACGIGALLLLFAVATLAGARVWPQAGALTAGAWAMVAPLLFGFAGEGAAFTVHMAVGVAALALAAAASDWLSRDLPEMPV